MQPQDPLTEPVPGQGLRGPGRSDGPTAHRAVVDTTTDDALGTSDAVDLLARLARHEVSPAELRAAATARARTANGPLNAVTQWIEQTPRTEVRVPDDAPLAGLPTLLKDNEPLAGYPTSNGSRAVPDVPATACSPLVGLFLSLGVDPVATTTLPEFGLTASTESSRYGATRNPWDTRLSVGGSSGGSAALVAAGVVPLAHANDGGGSIRIPASCAGLVGLKPSRGRLPDALGVDKLPVQMTVQGVLTRTVRDAALFHAAAERAWPAAGLPPIGHVTAPGEQRLRIGVCTTTVRSLPIDPQTVAAVWGAADLCASLGHHVVEVGPPVGDDFAGDFLAFWALLALLLHRGGRSLYGPDFDPDTTEVFTRGLSRRAVRQADRIPAALRRLRRLARDHEADFARYDVLLTPVTGHPPPPIGHLGPDVDFRTHLVRLLQFCSMTPVQNISGAPAISLPLGRTAAGIPIGVQFAAPVGQERRLLELALELEAADPWPLTPAQG
jgi:amidase